MNTSVKRALAVCVLAAVAFAGFGCGKKGADSEMTVETISLEQTKQDLTFDFGTKKTTQAAEDATEAPKDATEATAETVEGTQIEEVTQVVNVTDEEGHGVTDAAGQSVTDYTVVETRVVENQQPATAAQTQAQTAAYTPEYDTCKAYWLDMSQQGDYTFNGEFLTLTFEVNKDIPDGNYPVTIVESTNPRMPDIASWDLVAYTPVIINGEVAVNSTAAAQEDMSANDFCLKVNSQTAKQGETVTMTIDLANNPGFCGFVIDIQYDANALTIVEAEGGKDFDAAVHLN